MVAGTHYVKGQGWVLWPDAETAMIEVGQVCGVCRRCNRINVFIDGYVKWQEGASIKEAFPDMSADEREELETGVHIACANRTDEEEN